MTEFLSRNLGVHRLALFLAALGAIFGIVWVAKNPYHDLAERRWAHRYVEARNAEYPEARVVSLGYEVVLLSPSGETIRTFRAGSHRAPSWWEYLVPSMYVVAFGLVPFLLTHAVAWIHSGFRQAAKS